MARDGPELPKFGITAGSKGPGFTFGDLEVEGRASVLRAAELHGPPAAHRHLQNTSTSHGGGLLPLDRLPPLSYVLGRLLYYYIPPAARIQQLGPRCAAGSGTPMITAYDEALHEGLII